MDNSTPSTELIQREALRKQIERDMSQVRNDFAKEHNWKQQEKFWENSIRVAVFSIGVAMGAAMLKIFS